MRNILLIILCFCCINARAAEWDTLDNQIKVRVVLRPNVTRWGLVKFPESYQDSVGKRYPLFVFNHGSGQAGAGDAGLNKLGTDAFGKLLKDSANFPTKYVNPRSGKSYEFIIFCPQNQSTGTAYIPSDMLLFLRNKPEIWNRTDTNNIFLGGISLGGKTTIQFGGDGREDALAKIRALIPMSAPPTTGVTYSFAGVKAQHTPIWQFMSRTDNYTYVRLADSVEAINLTNPGQVRSTWYSGGHCCWYNKYKVSYRETIDGVPMNIYEWCLYQSTYDRTGEPDPEPEPISNTIYVLKSRLKSVAALTDTYVPSQTDTTVLQMFFRTNEASVPDWVCFAGTPHASVKTVADPRNYRNVSVSTVATNRWVPTGGSSTNTAGQQTPNPFWLYPATTLSGYFHSQATRTAGQYMLQVNNLEQGAVYQVEVAASRAASAVSQDERLCYYILTDKTGDHTSETYDVKGNTSNNVVFTSVEADANGRIYLIANPEGNDGSVYGYISVLKIIKKAP